MISTLGLVVQGIATILLAGYAPALLLLDRKKIRPRAAAIPGIGLAAFLVVTHFLAGLHLSGPAISLISPAVFGALVFAVPRQRRLDRQEVRDSLWVVAICCGGLLLAIWPMLREGYASFLGLGNADAAFNLAVFDGARHMGYRDPLVNAVSYWPGPQFGIFFGAGYLCVLLSVLGRVDIFGLHEVASSVLVFVVPSAVFLFSTVCLRATRRKALFAAAAAACSSQICYTFYLESIGAMTLIAMLPLFLALCSEMLESIHLRTALAVAVVFTGAMFGYYAATPILGLLLTAGTAAALAQRTVRWREVWLPVAAVAAVALAAFPALTVAMVTRSLMESGSTRLTASVNGPEILLSFAFTLTEQYLPFFWGLIITPFTSGTPFEPPARTFFLILGFSAVLWGVFLCLLFRPKTEVPIPVRLQAALLLAALFYFILRNNGYGAFKLAAWLTPITFSILVCGLLPDANPAGKGWGMRRLRYGLLLVFAGMNVSWAALVGAATVRDTLIPGKIMAGFTGADFIGLGSLSKRIPPGARILVAIPDAVVQRWALTYLRSANVSVVPYLSLSADEADASEAAAAAEAESARYLLTWSGASDIVPAATEGAIWSNGKFQLIPIDSVKDFLIVGRGWYRSEALPNSPEPWQHRFRWLRSQGELLLLNPSGSPLHLQLTAVSGYGDPAPSRAISFSIDGQKFDEVKTAGVTNLVTRPFRARGFISRLSISLADIAQPVPRSGALFRRWVPRDGRRLNIAVANVALAAAGRERPARAPCRLDLSVPEAWNSPGLSGIYGDRWIAGEAHVSLQPCGEADEISIAGSVPDFLRNRLPLSVQVTVDGEVEQAKVGKPGAFTVEVPLRAGFDRNRPHDIAVRCPEGVTPSESGAGSDRRRLSLRLDTIAIREKSGPAPDSR